MNTILLLLALTLTPPTEGTIIYNAHGSPLVIRQTNSEITHVSIILKHENTLYVYEAVFPKVKKTPWETWLKTYPQAISPAKRQRMTYSLATPNKEYTPEEIQRMHDYAEKQIGRPYSVRPYTKNKETPGIHCSEYITEIITQSKRYEPQNPLRTTPQNLYESLQNTHSYGPWQK